MPTFFDLKAATWDGEPRRLAMAMDIVVAIAQRIPLTGVSQERVHVMQKPPGGRSYPIFLAVARKP